MTNWKVWFDKILQGVRVINYPNFESLWFKSILENFKLENATLSLFSTATKLVKGVITWWRRLRSMMVCLSCFFTISLVALSLCKIALVSQSRITALIQRIITTFFTEEKHYFSSEKIQYIWLAIQNISVRLTLRYFPHPKFYQNQIKWKHVSAIRIANILKSQKFGILISPDAQILANMP